MTRTLGNSICSGASRAVLLLLLATVPVAFVFAQDGARRAPVTMEAGSIDVAVSGGLGSLVYPFVEPQVAVGILPIGPVTLSVGAVADAGYCLLCGLVGVATPEWRLNSYYFGAYGRVLAHISAVSDALGDAVAIDPYAGISVGPRFYVVSLEYTPSNASTTLTQSSIMIAPQVGARLFFNEESNFFGFAEARYLFEIGFESQSVELDGQTYTFSEDYASGGSTVALGVGWRL